jgi:hypothetical protein
MLRGWAPEALRACFVKATEGRLARNVADADRLVGVMERAGRELARSDSSWRGA